MITKYLKTTFIMMSLLMSNAAQADALAKTTVSSQNPHIIADERFFPQTGVSEADYLQFADVVKRSMGSYVNAYAKIIYNKEHKESAQRIEKILSSLGVGAPTIKFIEVSHGVYPVSVVITSYGKPTVRCALRPSDTNILAETPIMQDEAPCWEQSNRNLQTI